MINWSGVAAVLMALAVGLGAFGAHALRDRLDAYSMGVYEKAVFYHFVHALGLLIVSVLARVGALTEGAAGRVRHSPAWQSSMACHPRMPSASYASTTAPTRSRHPASKGS